MEAWLVEPKMRYRSLWGDEGHNCHVQWAGMADSPCTGSAETGQSALASVNWKVDDRAWPDLPLGPNWVNRDVLRRQGHSGIGRCLPRAPGQR